MSNTNTFPQMVSRQFESTKQLTWKIQDVNLDANNHKSRSLMFLVEFDLHTNRSHLMSLRQHIRLQRSSINLEEKEWMQLTLTIHVQQRNKMWIMLHACTNFSTQIMCHHIIYCYFILNLKSLNYIITHHLYTHNFIDKMF